jgi:hypothetical protein
MNYATFVYLNSWRVTLTLALIPSPLYSCNAYNINGIRGLNSLTFTACESVTDITRFRVDTPDSLVYCSSCSRGNYPEAH